MRKKVKQETIELVKQTLEEGKSISETAKICGTTKATVEWVKYGVGRNTPVTKTIWEEWDIACARISIPKRMWNEWDEVCAALQRRTAG